MSNLYRQIRTAIEALSYWPLWLITHKEREMSTSLNKLEYKALLADSSQLAIRLTNQIESGTVSGFYEYRARHTCVKLWQRHWRMTVRYNKLFGANRYVPEWYIAELELENEWQN